jgi:purine-binding chemotaxis protein CheW
LKRCRRCLGTFRRFPITTPQLLIFTLDEERYALRLAAVERVVRAAAITPLPKAPEIVLGVLDFQGQVIPVINLRQRFRLPERALRTSDQFVIARAGVVTVALAVDGVESVLEEHAREIIEPDDILTGTGFLEGVTRNGDGLVLIHDLATLLFPEEERLLAQALKQGGE